MPDMEHYGIGREHPYAILIIALVVLCVAGWLFGFVGVAIGLIPAFFISVWLTMKIYRPWTR